MNRIETNLLEGEEILWSGKSAPFPLLEKPYKITIISTWVICGVLLFGLSVFYLSYAIPVEESLKKILIVLSVLLGIPLLVAARPLMDYRILQRKACYAVTNYRVITAYSDKFYSLPLAEDMPLRVDRSTDTTGTILLGDASKHPERHGRMACVCGIREDSGNTSVISGFSFYNVEDPEAVCRCIRNAAAGIRPEEASSAA